MLNRDYFKVNYKDLQTSNDYTIAYNHIKGYWTIKYLEENYPGFLKDLFNNNLAIEKNIAEKLGYKKNSKIFWEDLDKLILQHYKKSENMR